ncbi:MAG: hypothetical protein KDD61_09890 [Bdellovibrionales bacterium]|nr:hypothetical protein [Bdellovibrionales bacterium]
MNMISFLMLIFTLPCFAAETEQGYMIDAKLDFKGEDLTVRTATKQILSKNMNMWTPLNRAEKGVVLLGRKTSEEQGTLGFEFMVIDTNKNPIQVSQSGIKALVGERAEVITEETDTTGRVVGSVAIQFLVTKAEYKEENK